jgi:hypothetical protein
MSCPRRAPGWLTATLLLVAPPAAGQDTATGQSGGAGPEYVPYRPAMSGPFVTFGALLPPPRMLQVQPFLSAAAERGRFDAQGRSVPLAPGESNHLATLTLYLEWALTRRLSVGAQGVLVHARSELPPEKAASTGFGDTLVFLRGVVLEERTTLPAAALLGLVKLPTGRAISRPGSLLEVEVRGTGTWDLTLGLTFTKGLRPVLLHADALFTAALPAHVGGVTTRLAPTLGWSIAAEWPFWPHRLGLLVEVSGRHQGAPILNGVREEDARVDEVVLGSGLEVLFSDHLQLLVGWRRVMAGRNVGAFDTLVATLVPVLPL